MSKPQVAMLGLGTMGSGMAQNLLKAGFPLTVYNRSAAKAAPLAEAGARVAASPRAAAEDADIIVSMVADDRASRTVWLGEQGALHAAKPGALLIESSTLTAGWIKELAHAAHQRGCELIDAPVTGSRTHAESGEVLFLAGGSAEAIERAKPALDAMGRGTVHIGPTGSGALMKLVNNFVCAVQTVTMAEAIAWIERTDLDRSTALDVLLNGAPGSPLVKTITARINAQDYVPPYFYLHLMAKDLSYAQQEAAQAGVELDTAACALAAFQRAISDGYGDQDMAAVVQSLRRRLQRV